MNKLATVEQLVNGRARKILQNYPNAVLPHHVQWGRYCWDKLVGVIVPLVPGVHGAPGHYNGEVGGGLRKLLLICLSYIHTVLHIVTICL